jgi:hypothetical protein
MKRIVLFFVGLSTAVTLLYCNKKNKEESYVSPEKNQAVVYLDQGWSQADREEFYWAPQGSALISTDIYLALIDPISNLPINDPRFTQQFGFISENYKSNKNPYNMPVGLASSTIKDGPFKGTYMGVTCAACHTNQVSYQGKAIRIDGGNSTHIRIEPWLQRLSTALDTVQNNPKKFKQLLAKINTKKAVSEADVKARLAEDAEYLRSWVYEGMFSNQISGPGRMDAFGGEGNAFLGMHTGIWENINPTVAPVKPPFLWNSSHSSWVEWSGVAANPLIRNYSQALGVFARYNLKANADPKNYFETSIDFKKIIELEKMIRRLAPPKWPEQILGKIDAKKAARGAQLFKANCATCHSVYPHRWSEPRMENMRMIENTLVPQRYVGTDDVNLNSKVLEMQPVVFTKHLSSLFDGKEQVTSTEFFTVIESKMMAESIKKSGLSAAELLDANGYIDLSKPMGKAPSNCYKAAPRDGSWAIGPFLHNGSVPNLFELLSPLKERSTTFYMNSDFDAKKVGISTDKKSGFLYNTQIKGNSNAGHLFDNKNASGVIGRLLTKKERYELIEYLKSIPNKEGQITPYGGPSNPIDAKMDKTWFGNIIK